MRVGIVSFEFEGVTRNGGIGTAYRLLAETLAASGAHVTVLLTQENYKDADLKAAQASLRDQKIEIEPVRPAKRFMDGNPWFVGQALAVHERLRSRQFDIVHFPENIGACYYALLHKKFGLGFHKTLFVAGLHGPTSWVRSASSDPFSSDEELLLFEFEKRSTELADIVVSPSEYMLAYTRSEGWKLPTDTFALPNVNRLGSASGSGSKKVSPEAERLVFFGRLEARKGLFIFLEAIRELFQRPDHPKHLPVVFLGRDVRLKWGEKASDYIRRELGSLGHRLHLEFLDDLSSAAAIKYLRDRPDSLVCMPSPVDNSPYVIVEALEEGFNFIASSKGGQAELIHPDDRALALFEPNALELADKLQERLFQKSARIRPEPRLSRSAARWVDLHRKWFARVEQTSDSASKIQTSLDTPLVSVCINPSDHPHGVQSTIESVEQGLYPNVEILVGSNQPELDDLGPVIRRVSAVPGKPWMKRFAAAAKGKYLLFVDGTASLQAHAISLLVQIAETQSRDRLCSGFARISPEHQSQSVFPTPEHPISGALRFDPRVPLLFQTRASFLNDSRGSALRSLDRCSNEPALWMLESVIRRSEFQCVPITLVRVKDWVPSVPELDRFRALICSVTTGYLPPGLSGLLPGLVRAAHEADRLRAEIRGKDRAIDLIKKTFGGPAVHA